MFDFSIIFKNCQSLPDKADYFPSNVFKLMNEEKILQLGIPEEFTGTPNPYPIFEALLNAGKASLSVGRIYEGHINALKLIRDLGTARQKQFYFEKAEEGKLFSVWNTEMKDDELYAETEDKKDRQLLVKGAKTFCSGGLHIDYALVTAMINNGKQLLVIPIKNFDSLKEDWSLWKPMGMRNSVSCRIDFSGLKISADCQLGDLNAYEKEPWFTGGAMRFAAVQLGGVEAIFDAVIEHLIQQQRTENPFQQQRVGVMKTKLESGKLWLLEAQKIYDDPQLYTSNHIMNFANMMRSEVLEIAEATLQLAEKSVGVQGFMEGHPLERVYRDLKVYLKQPGPDFALQHIGRYAFNHKQ